MANVDSYFDSDDEGTHFAIPRQAPSKTVRPVLSIDSPAPARIVAAVVEPSPVAYVDNHQVGDDDNDDNDERTFARPLPVDKKQQKAAKSHTKSRGGKHTATAAAAAVNNRRDSPYEPRGGAGGYSSGEDEDEPLELDSHPPSVAATPCSVAQDEEAIRDDDDDDQGAVPYADDTPEQPRARNDEYELDDFVVNDDDDDDDGDDDDDERSSGPLGFTPMAGLEGAGRKRGADGAVRSRRQVIKPLRHWLNERQIYTAVGPGALQAIRVVRSEEKTPSPRTGRQAVDGKEKRRRVRQFEGVPSPEVEADDEPLKVVKREERLDFSALSSVDGRTASMAAGVYNAPSGQFAVRAVTLLARGKLRVNKRTLTTSHSFYVVSGQCKVQMVDQDGEVTTFGCRKGAHFFCPAGFQARVVNEATAEVKLNHYVFNG
jgi:hypothetical protein